MIPLVSVKWKRASSPVQAGTSCFFSCSDVDLGVCLKFQVGSHVSTVLRHETAFLSSCKRGFRPPVKLNWDLGLFSNLELGYQSSLRVVS